jgi:YidC/Oxa1 family membrane protein insertase
MPQYINSGMEGLFSLGPYLNLLPLLSVVLIIMQQKMFMPPPADEQAAMQQKIMQYMMVFMGVMFYKVASGLCIYFIVQSLWGFVERKFLPKMAPIGGNGDGKTSGGAAAVETRAEAKARTRRAAEAAQAKQGRSKKWWRSS